MKLPVRIPGYDKWRLAGPPEHDELTEAERSELAEDADGLGDYLLEQVEHATRNGVPTWCRGPES